MAMCHVASDVQICNPLSPHFQLPPANHSLKEHYEVLGTALLVLTQQTKNVCK